MVKECPYCDHVLAAEEIRFVAAHPDLSGDPVLGDPWPVRFLPVRFNADGDAIDPAGTPSSQMACPNCRASLPRQCLGVPVAQSSIRVMSAESMSELQRRIEIACEKLAPDGCHVQMLELANQPPMERDVVWHEVCLGQARGLLVSIRDSNCGSPVPDVSSIEEKLKSLVIETTA
ncbi:MAG: hypothetical protein MK077_03350 [Phycisphaerales bacterium]|nr:hypothetical protein [Phycisphaerales bacterium]